MAFLYPRSVSPNSSDQQEFSDDQTRPHCICMSLLRNFVPVELTIDAGQLNIISIRIVDNCQPNFELRTVRIMAKNLQRYEAAIAIAVLPRG